jgi:hypothetical protein
MRSICLHLALALSAALPLSLEAQAPFGIGGVATSTAYYDRATFTITNSPGYSYDARLDGSPVPVGLSVTLSNMDYHELLIWRTNLADTTVSNRLLRFIVCDSTRSGTEEGIPKWVPRNIISSAPAEFLGADLRVLTPLNYPTNLDIPAVAWVEDAQGHAVRVNGWVGGAGLPSFRLLRGVGSGLLPGLGSPGPLHYDPQVGGLQIAKTITLESGTTWSNVGGTLSGSVVWPANSRIAVTNWLNIPAGSSLTIGAGTVVRLNYRADVTNNGTVILNGTADEPVVFTPASRAQPWGGFLLNSASSIVMAYNAIFTGSGAESCWYNRSEAPYNCNRPSQPGSHKTEQALFHCAAGASVTLSNCAAVSLFGQFGHSMGAFTMNCTRLLVQGVTGGGQYAAGGGIRMNDCALMQVPVISDSFIDFDNDALYLESGGHAFTNTLVGWTKDDLIDSGGGNSGTNFFIRCWFEAPAHECIAGSGSGKVNFLRDTVAIHAGQGFETGYDAVTNFADRCLVTDTFSGSRFADNYLSGYNYTGFMRTTNSLLLYNYRNIYGMCWRDWTYHTGQMDARSNWLSVADAYWPNNTVWNPATDGWRLASFLSTPPGAAVGVAFATWTNWFNLASIFDGALVGLSCFATNDVSVDYAFQDGGGATLATGTLNFAPGETMKRIYPAGFDVAAQSLVRLVLSNPVRGELTGETNVVFQGGVPAAQITCWTPTNTLPLGRLAEGLLVKLSTPAGQTVRVDYAYTTGAGTPASGTLTFAPGQTVQRIDPAGANPPMADPIRLTLSNPVGAALAGFTSVIYGTPPVQVFLAVGSSQLDLATFTNGLPVGLNGPSVNTVSVNFRCEGPGGVLTNGTLSFAPGLTLQTLRLPTVNPKAYDLLRVGLFNAANAELVSPSNVCYVRVVPGPSPLLVTAGSAWRYLDTGGDAGTAWRALSYDDGSWSNGVAQLGFGDSPRDEVTFIRQVGTNGANSITWYFRQKFVVDNPGLFTNLAMWLLRDDGGVVYVNGTDAYRSPSMPQAPTTITYQTLATNQSTTSAPADNTVDTANLNPGLLVAGTNIVAVEIHQFGASSSDVSFDFSLTGQPTPQAPPPTVYWGKMGADWLMAWSDPSFQLWQATNVLGPWTLSPSTSPVTVTATNTQIYYRLRK